MRGPAFALVGLLLPSIVGAQAQLVAQDSGENAVALTVASFHSALEQRDRGRALAALSPDVVIYESGEAELSRDEYAAHHLEADTRFAASTKTELVDRRTIISGDLASVISRTKTSGTFAAKPIDVIGTETMLLRRDAEGRWSIVHIHWSSHRRSSS